MEIYSHELSLSYFNYVNKEFGCYCCSYYTWVLIAVHIHKIKECLKCRIRETESI